MVDVKWKRDQAPDGTKTDNAFNAYDADNDGYVGRIYIQPGGHHGGQWAWFLGASSGIAETKQQAADAVRKRWQEVCARRPEAQAELWPYHMREKP